MSWRIVVISKRAKLDLQLGYMIVRSEEVTKIVLSEISTVLIESTAVSLTTSLIAELAKRKIRHVNWSIIMVVMTRAIKSENRLHGSRIRKKQCGLKLLQKK